TSEFKGSTFKQKGATSEFRGSTFEQKGAISEFRGSTFEQKGATSEFQARPPKFQITNYVACFSPEASITNYELQRSFANCDR
ncbi:hypothetical protein, partial [Nostoc sp. ChiQUE01b]|uniref:hypothetical protein n=1 Tax=Nostoc sp. ChiQUE01b TaxID=3075376 RepID=UPI002AD3CD62